MIQGMGWKAPTLFKTDVIMKNRRWYILLILAVVTAVVWFIYGVQQPDPMSYGAAVDLGGNAEAKPARYYVKLEYKAPQTIAIQYDTLPGIPSPHPARVQINEVFFHEGLYVYQGKPTQFFYGSIVHQLDSTGTLYRVHSIKML